MRRLLAGRLMPPSMADWYRYSFFEFKLQCMCEYARVTDRASELIATVVCRVSWGIHPWILIQRIGL